MGSNKLPYFPFHAQDWLNDPVVAGMSAEAEGCYIRLLARSWLSETPGRVPAALAPEFGGMHRVPDKDDRPYLMFESVRSAFDTVSEKGVWIQRRMVREYERLAKNYDARVAGALKTLEKRAQPSRLPSRSPSRSPGVEVEVDREVEESKSNPSSLRSVAVNGSSSKKLRPPKNRPEDKEWLDTFDETWWPEYLSLGRKCSRAAAREVWILIPHSEGQSDFDLLNAEWESWRETWREEKREVRRIPHAATWLRDYLKNLMLEAS
jgi:uncharacterized protein YdaU (DUF1376 family)